MGILVMVAKSTIVIRREKEMEIKEREREREKDIKKVVGVTMDVEM